MDIRIKMKIIGLGKSVNTKEKQSVKVVMSNSGLILRKFLDLKDILLVSIIIARRKELFSQFN